VKRLEEHKYKKLESVRLFSTKVQRWREQVEALAIENTNIIQESVKIEDQRSGVDMEIV
jgi:hypothetical protein